MGFKHPIRDLFLLWFGERLWKRHEAKKNLKRNTASTPYNQNITQDSYRK